MSRRALVLSLLLTAAAAGGGVRERSPRPQKPVRVRPLARDADWAQEARERLEQTRSAHREVVKGTRQRAQPGSSQPANASPEAAPDQLPAEEAEPR